MNLQESYALSFNSLWELVSSVTFLANAGTKGSEAAFNSLWELVGSVTRNSDLDRQDKAGFQFPVGISRFGDLEQRGGGGVNSGKLSIPCGN